MGDEPSAELCHLLVIVEGIVLWLEGAVRGVPEMVGALVVGEVQVVASTGTVRYLDGRGE
jgi:hypothetical protein